MKKVKWIIILAVVGAGIYFWTQKSKSTETEAAGPAYDVEKVERRDIRITVETTGEVQPRNRLDVKPPIAGRLEELLVDEGASVKKGQILGWISSTERATLLDAALATSQDEYEYWADLYKPSPLISPLEGTIIARNFEPGQSIASADAVVVIADNLIIIANLDETDIGQIENDQQVLVSLEAYPDREFSCVVEKIAYDAKTVSNVTMYEVDVRANQLPGFARSGMTANLEFIVEEKDGALTLPVSAIQQKVGSQPDVSSMSEADRKSMMVERMKARGLSEAEIQERLQQFAQNGGPGGPGGGQDRGRGPANASVENFILVASADPEKPEMKRVKIGVSDGFYTEILEGLAEGDEVLIQRMNLGSKKSGGGGLFSPTMGGRGPR